MDYKLPSSGCEEKMLLSNMEALRKQDTTKVLSTEITRPSPTFISMQASLMWDFSVVPMKVQSRT